MPLSGSGTFTRIYSWADDSANSIPITDTRMDDEFDGIADALSNALYRDGQSTATAKIPLALGASIGDGSVGAPSLNFISDTDCGIWRVGANNIALGVAGAKVLDISTTGLAVTGQTTLDTGLSGLLKATAGVVSAASAGTDYYKPTGTDVALADGGTGASLADPNADRILFWDDSAGQVTWLTAGAGLTITGTTIDAAAASSSFATIAVSGQSDVVADSTADTLTLAAGAGVAITTNAGSDTVTFAASGGLLQVDVFSSSQTVTIPAGATKAKVTLWGGGGGGAGADALGGDIRLGGAGGGPGALLKYLTSLTPGNTLALTIGAAGTAGSSGNNSGGAGGNSTLASGTQTISTLTANGGAAGTSTAGGGVGGTGGTASGGDLNATGQAGAGGFDLSNGTTDVVFTSADAINGTQGGVGGLGIGFGGNGGTSAQSAVAGTAGIVGGCIIEWYS